MIGTGAVSVVPPIAGLTGPGALGPADGVHTVHTMGDVHTVMDTLHRRDAATAVVVGAGYIGLEMAEALTARGCAVTQIEALPEVLPTLDPELGQLVRAELTAHGVEVLTATTVSSIARSSTSGPALVVSAEGAHGTNVSRTVDIVLVVVGVRPDSELAQNAGALLGVKGAVQADTPGDGNDVVTTANGNDTISGGAGNDSIVSGEGDDTVDAGDGNDRVLAGGGQDKVHGGDDDDRLEGGEGNDQLWGEAGADVLIGDGGDDILDGGPGPDMVNGGSGKNIVRDVA